MFLTMFFKTQNIVQTMLIAHPYVHRLLLKAGAESQDGEWVKERQELLHQLWRAPEFPLSSKILCIGGGASHVFEASQLSLEEHKKQCRAADSSPLSAKSLLSIGQLLF